MTLDDRLSSRAMSQYANMSARTTDSLDSKLSPRAYPTNAPRAARVATGERSAFQRVSPESAQHYPPPYGFYNSNYNNNNEGKQSTSKDKRGVGATVSLSTMKPYVLAGVKPG